MSEAAERPRRTASEHSAAAWAQSGLMALSGWPAVPVIPRFDAMTQLAKLFAAVENAAATCDARLVLDTRMLTERAALMGLTRGGQISCNGSCRIIEAQDGWLAVNLPRDTDRELVPAFVGCGAGEDPWRAVTNAARQRSIAELVDAGRLLGLAVGAIPHAPVPSAEPFRLHVLTHGRSERRSDPLVIDLSALWAGPLCGHLLAETGARVIKVESARRPDSVRDATPAVFDRLNAGKESVVLDFTEAADLRRLRALLARADVVIGSARPRAFEQLGLEPEELIAANHGLTWVAITAAGWLGFTRNTVGFGDDAAAAGGLLVEDAEGRPLFAGDAIADPLAGFAAAAGAFTGLARGGGVLVDVSLRDAAAFVAAGDPRPTEERARVVCLQGCWHVEGEGWRVPVMPPRARPWTRRATAFGADTARVVQELT